MKGRVGTLAELRERGGCIRTEIEGVKFGVFELSDGLFALENRCAHQGGPLCNGSRFRRLTAEVMPSGRVREFYASEEEDVIACPWHGWEYDIRSGVVLGDPRRKVRTFDVEVVGDDVYVEIPDRLINKLAPASAEHELAAMGEEGRS